jgi:hypothetical protein
MSQKLQTIIGQLKVSLDDALDVMGEVEDWLFNNYGLKKVAANEIVIDKNELKTQSLKIAHNPGVRVNRAEDGDHVEVDDKPITEFARRAGIITAKKAVDMIKGKAGRTSGAADPSEFVGVDDEYGDEEVFVPESSNQRLPAGDNPLEGLFDGAGENKISKELEMMKLRKLQYQGEGKFRRQGD